MFKKILVANRGEIAVRVLRACREAGISGVAVYSDVDRAALHVLKADEAYPIGPAPALESYLRMDHILEVAKRCRAEAIHPGYGFLAENPEFPEACEKAGIVFIGPGAQAMRLLGNKISALRTAREVKVPSVPSSGAVEDLATARKLAKEIGYPVMLKASAGGGGKGLRLVQSEKELEQLWQITRDEVAASFKDPTVFLEKYLPAPRHIEIQVMADQDGKVIYFPERECSLQRRHQKILEESPSPIVDPSLRRRMGEAAARLAKKAGYQNAGTVEFLVDRDRNFYFLEMNTRLQVEHPVTEMVTGVDLLHWQIRIAAGEKISLRQDEIQPRGHVLECRINAEDPENQFAPSPGRIQCLEEPGGPGVRCDSGVYAGSEVPIHYDPLISKLVVYGATREEALARSLRALSEYRIAGIRTSIPFFQTLLTHPRVLAGDLSTELLSEILQQPQTQDGEGWQEAVIAAALMYQQSQRRRIESAPSRWRTSAWDERC
ncbi:MAG: acetyl-CoA carboxylase biotin carboxylase subunit [Acidobacteria bacterium]|nr:acetyl-CoA carboxylase biotin carboxylase subunit [Acidobacteriota bacterium]